MIECLKQAESVIASTFRLGLSSSYHIYALRAAGDTGDHDAIKVALSFISRERQNFCRRRDTHTTCSIYFTPSR